MNSGVSDALRKVLEARNEGGHDDGSGDVVFAMFLEPIESTDNGVFQRVVDYVVSRLQPSPALVHVELVVPCAPASSEPVNFATYIGCKSAWQTDRSSNASYYLSTTANKWRAVPVFGKHAARNVRKACEKSKGVEYSLLRYLTAAWGVRKLSGIIPDGSQDPAHCATLSARVLKAGVGAVLKHPSSWYGPSTLYTELCNDLKDRSIVPDSTSVGEDVASRVDCLLRRRDQDVSSMTYQDSMSAIRALTLKASAAEAMGDDVMATLTQKQLANALFRWSVLRSH